MTGVNGVENFLKNKMMRGRERSLVTEVILGDGGNIWQSKIPIMIVY